ncbi:MAG: hypothetical protein ACRC2N_02730 [Aeromonas sp.]
MTKNQLEVILKQIPDNGNIDQGLLNQILAALSQLQADLYNEMSSCYGIKCTHIKNDISNLASLINYLSMSQIKKQDLQNMVNDLKKLENHQKDVAEKIEKIEKILNKIIDLLSKGYNFI